MNTLTDGKLLVNLEEVGIFEVTDLKVVSDMMIQFTLEPNEYSVANGVESEILTFDPLNETLVSFLKENGYRVIKPCQVKSIQK